MDGVMFDTERLAVEAWISAGKQTGWDIGEEMLIETIGISGKNSLDIFRRYLGETFDFAEVRACKTRYVEAYIRENGIPVKPGLYELLDYISAHGYKIALASSTAKDQVVMNLKKAGVLAYFQYMVCGDMIDKGKPEPDIYLAACSGLGLAPGCCLALEDSPAGILSAARAGLQTVLIPDLVAPGEMIKAVPYIQLPSLSSVINLLSTHDERIKTP